MPVYMLGGCVCACAHAYYMLIWTQKVDIVIVQSTTLYYLVEPKAHQLAD